jgi:predicted Zn-dependent peptidase
MLLAMQIYDLGIDFLQKRNDYIKEVTLQAVNAAAKKYFSKMPDLMYIGILDTKEKK